MIKQYGGPDRFNGARVRDPGGVEVDAGVHRGLDLASMGPGFVTREEGGVVGAEIVPGAEASMGPGFVTREEAAVIGSST